MSIIERAKRRINLEYQERYLKPKLVKNKQKIFCIGRNKTGTTSLRDAFRELKFITGNESRAGLLLDDYIENNFDPIIDFCKSAQVFKDVPFSLPDTYKYLDKAYPDSKFILTERDNPDQWYSSVVKFHSRIFGKGKVPTVQDLKEASFIYKGWSWKLNRKIYNTPLDDLYNSKILKSHYIKYNEDVKKYFEGRDNLLVINVSQKGDYKRFCDFLGLESDANDFPWKNKTTEIKIKK